MLVLLIVLQLISRIYYCVTITSNRFTVWNKIIFTSREKIAYNIVQRKFIWTQWQVVRIAASGNSGEVYPVINPPVGDR